MRIQRSFLALATLSIMAAGLVQAQDDGAEQRAELDATANETLQNLYSAVDGTKALFDQAEGYAVFNATKAGFGISGGGDVLLSNDSNLELGIRASTVHGAMTI